MLLHRFATIGHGAECSHMQCALACHNELLRIGNQRELALRLQCRSIDKLHGIVLVALVPEAYATVLIGATPEVHRDARVALGLNLTVVAIRSEDKLAHATGSGRCLHHLILGSRSHMERIALLVGQLIATSGVARHLPQLSILAHCCRGGHVHTRLIGRDGIAAVNELNEIPHRITIGAHRGKTLRQSAHHAQPRAEQREKKSFHHCILELVSIHGFSCACLTMQR